jgi:high-affinity nickel permease
MAGLISILALGFVLGMRHATDADHVIAVTTIVARHRSIRHAAMVGGLWGVGHTMTILLVGSGIILFGIAIPPRVGLAMELSVGLMLILLGALNLSGILQRVTNWLTPRHPVASKELHSHAEDDAKHEHSLGWLDRRLGGLGAYQALRPLAVGIVHGLAGSAAVALLVLATIRVPTWAIAYLLVFGIGTVAGMMLITAAIAVPFRLSSERFARLNRGLTLASGAISLAFGAFIVYHMGFVNGLFTRNPIWRPE